MSFQSTKSFGFSLIELIVVLAIVIILMGIGVPSYKKYRESVISTESKVQLSKIYMFETAFEQDWKTFHGNLIALGATPKGVLNYNVGFKDSSTTMTIPHHPYLNQNSQAKGCYNYKSICQSCGCGTYCGNLKANQCEVKSESSSKNLNISKGEVTSTTFTAEYIREFDGKNHIWTIDQDEKVENH